MAGIEVYLPAMGEGIREATITRWLRKEGDFIKEDESLVEVATDKVDSEIPSPAEGTITKLMFKEGDVPAVGSVIAIIATGKDEKPKGFVEKSHEQTEQTAGFKTFARVPLTDVKNEKSLFTGRTTPAGKFLSPLVRSIADKEEISEEELDTIEGSGQDGRITRDDLVGFIRGKKTIAPVIIPELPETVPPPEERKTVQNKESVSAVPYGPGVEIIEMDRMRRLIADNMVRSKHVSPHVTSFIEIDVTDLVEWREKTKEPFFQREKEKLTFTPFFIEAAARALKDFPMVNVSVDGTNILVKKFINIGIATALPSGNLIVPVIKNADQRNLTGLAKAINDLAGRARNNKLLPDEISGGTFTITNFGTFANLTGTPVINQPEVAILGVGAIVKKPAVVSTSKGDFIGIRQMLILSLSYDHRVVDGALGGQFLRRIGDYLESWDTGRNI